MDEGQVKRTKSIDEKFCGECGEIIRLKAEICPKCGVRQMPVLNLFDSNAPRENDQLSNDGLVQKFFMSTAIGFVIFVLIVLGTTPRQAWGNGFIGSVMFAAVAGIIAMIIPSKRKIIYLPSSIGLMLFVAMIVGLVVQK